ncbi:Calcium channel [Lachnellula suecica]|uniref:Calcium channel n=1 Tax=Lachnellula suecica TaxID=602035 RepID=A0A8T9CEG6_9HELO|nr:Calcium channel [Lachnellula suecica]
MHPEPTYGPPRTPGSNAPSSKGPPGPRKLAGRRQQVKLELAPTPRPRLQNSPQIPEISIDRGDGDTAADMVQWKKLFGVGGQDQHLWREEARRLLPTYHEDDIPSAIPAPEVTKVAIRLRYLIEECVPCELEEDTITAAHSRIITPKVIKAAKEAGGQEYAACVVYALLVNKRWFKKQAMIELWDADLHNVRATACEVIAKALIEGEDDQDYLLQDMLLKRYSIMIDGEQTAPANVIERAVDLHALRVTGSSGYQKCVNYLWRGWLIQDENDPSVFVDFKKKSTTNYWTHVDPDRMRAPIYQNATQIIFSLIYLGLFTGAINTVNPTGDLDVVEIMLYIFTVGFLCDEFSKFWKVGRYYIGFWNVFNLVLYGLLATSLVTRFIALSHDYDNGDGQRGKFNELSYNFLAFSAPMFWMRLLLYLDTIRFFGAMLVVLKVMMKESLIFFALLIVIIVGFLQAFIGLDNADSNADATTFILQAMANAVMQSPDFSGFDAFAPPFGIILYYIFTFLIMVVLLNILIALYNSAYEDITDNAIDEYMALFAQKTMQFVRAPDENVFIAPLNLVEIFVLIIPFEWWMPRRAYARLNDYVMAVIYSPLLFVAAYFETRSAKHVKSNRRRGEEDDDVVEEWEQMEGEVDFEGEGWDKKVESVKPDVEADQATTEVRKLRSEVGELKVLIERLLKKEHGA